MTRRALVALAAVTTLIGCPGPDPMMMTGGGSAGGGLATGGGSTGGGVAAGGSAAGGAAAGGSAAGGTAGGSGGGQAGTCPTLCAGFAACSTSCLSACTANETEARALGCTSQFAAIGACVAMPGNGSCSGSDFMTTGCATQLAAYGACAMAAMDGGSAGGSAGGGSAGGGSAGGGSAGGGTALPLGPFDFLMGRDNFAFENYVNDNQSPMFMATNLTPVEVERLFGRAACGGDDAGCVLTPPARQWMETTNREMGGGHCEGMAVLSALFATGTISPRTFGADSGIELAIAGNEPLQREIAYWWALQGTEPTISAEQRNQRTPNQILSDLAAGLDAGQAFTFGLFKRDGKGGHANTPYAIVPVDAGIVAVMLYENNFPMALKSVEIDTVANTWRYEATPNPQTAAELYDGDAVTKNLSIVPVSARLQPPLCPFCGSVAMNGTSVRGSAVSYRELQLSGEGELTVYVADAGTPSIFRTDAGVWTNTLAGASIGSSRRGPATWNIEFDPIFRLPLNVPVTVGLDGYDLTAPAQAAVTMTAPGSTFSVEGISLDPGQLDVIEFGAGANRVSYVTTGMETPVVELGVTLDGEDYLFQIIAGAEASGVVVTLVNDVPNGKLHVDVDSADGMASYGVSIFRIDDGEEVFTHLSNTLATSATVFMNYRSWPGQGSPMLFELDVNGDGIADMSQMVSDDN